MGLDGFVWFFGVIESRQDPLNLGRLQVRVLGWHPEDTTTLPTEDLPWAHPVLPLSSKALPDVSEGTWVVGFFIDGKQAQQPVILGWMPNFST